MPILQRCSLQSPRYGVPQKLFNRPSTWITTRLSHVGSKPIIIPSSVTCEVQQVESSLLDRNKLTKPMRRSFLTIRGPRGFHRIPLATGLSVQIHSGPASPNNEAQQSTLLNISCDNTDMRSAWGLARSLCANAVVGVSDGFVLPVRLVGVGYRAVVEEQNINITEMKPLAKRSHQQLVLRLGYPRPVRLEIPQSIDCTIATPTDIHLKGHDLQELGRFAASLRRWRKPEPYNGKGIFVGNEKVTRKEIKKK